MCVVDCLWCRATRLVVAGRTRVAPGEGRVSTVGYAGWYRASLRTSAFLCVAEVQPPRAARRGVWLGPPPCRIAVDFWTSANGVGSPWGHAPECRGVFPQVRAVGGSESACTPDSVRTESVVTIHLGRRLPDGSCGLPGGRTHGRAVLPLFGLAPGGVCRATRVTPGAGALLPHRFTLTCAPARSRRHRRSALCCTFLRVAPTGCYPAPCPVESGRSSDRYVAARHAAARPARCQRPGYGALRASVTDAIRV